MEYNTSFKRLTIVFNTTPAFLSEVTYLFPQIIQYCLIIKINIYKDVFCYIRIYTNCFSGDNIQTVLLDMDISSDYLYRILSASRKLKSYFFDNSVSGPLDRLIWETNPTVYK